MTFTSSDVVTEGGSKHLHEYLLMSDQRADDDPSTLSTNNTDPLVPIYTDKTPIAWDGNPAHIAGCLYDVGKFYKRTGLFQMFLKHRAVPLSNGKLAVDFINMQGLKLSMEVISLHTCSR